MSLNDQQRRFADALLAGLNPSDAYRKAGYKSKGNSVKAAASRLLTNVNVAAYLDKHRKRAEEKTGVTIEWIIERLKTNVERSMQAEPVIGPDGEEIGEYRYAGNVANKALELLGKHLGMFFDNDAAKESPALPEQANYSATDMSRNTDNDNPAES